MLNMGGGVGLASEAQDTRVFHKNKILPSTQIWGVKKWGWFLNFEKKQHTKFQVWNQRFA